MATRIEPNDLKSYEVTFEISCRGVAPKSNQCLCRAQLRSLLRSTNVQFKSVGDFEANQTEIAQTISELHDLLHSTEEDPRKLSLVEQRRVSSRLCHLVNRISLLVVNNEAEARVKEEFSSEAAILESLLFYATNDVEKIDLTDLNISHAVDTSVLTSAVPPVSPSRHNHVVPSPKYVNIMSKPVPVSQWRLQFTGNIQKLSVMSFLERVDELKVARNISDEELFRTCIDLFSEQALSWYRSVRMSVTNWQELTAILKRDFLPEDYDECLMSEIRLRTQGPMENLQNYILSVEALFRRLGEKKTESEIVKQIIRNLHPSYAHYFVMHKIATLSELKEQCRQIQCVKTRSDKYRPPPNKKSQVLEPDLACLPSHSLDSLPNPPHIVDAVPLSSSPPGNNIICWNCDNSGHTHRQCQKLRNFFCYACGRKNVSVKSCPSCNSKNGKGGATPRQSSFAPDLAPTESTVSENSQFHNPSISSHTRTNPQNSSNQK